MGDLVLLVIASGPERVMEIRGYTIKYNAFFNSSLNFIVIYYVLF